MQIDTPESSIRAYEKGKFRVDVFDSGKTEITNFRGTIYAESREGRTEIERGRTLYMTERGDAEFGPLPPADEWEKWNRQRDTKLADWRPPSKYLPEDLRAYSRDFDDNGRWVYSEEYGQVWTPNVVVSVGWAPYRLGRWVWIGGDYTWVSYEPWGWVPYHYGRWSFVAPSAGAGCPRFAEQFTGARGMSDGWSRRPMCPGFLWRREKFTMATEITGLTA